jgi:hypothetical protein
LAYKHQSSVTGQVLGRRNACSIHALFAQGAIEIVTPVAALASSLVTTAAVQGASDAGQVAQVVTALAQKTVTVAVTSLAGRETDFADTCLQERGAHAGETGSVLVTSSAACRTGLAACGGCCQVVAFIAGQACGRVTKARVGRARLTDSVCQGVVVRAVKTASRCAGQTAGRALLALVGGGQEVATRT